MISNLEILLRWGRHLWGSAIASAGEALVSETPLWPKMLPLAGAGFDFCYFSATCQWYFSGGRSFFSFWGFWREIGWKCDMETFFFRFWPVQSFRSSIAYTVADPSFGWGLKPPRLAPTAEGASTVDNKCTVEFNKKKIQNLNSIGMYHSSDTVWNLQKFACRRCLRVSIPKDFSNHHFDGGDHILPFCKIVRRDTPYWPAIQLRSCQQVCQRDWYSTCRDVDRLLLQLPQRCDCWRPITYHVADLLYRDSMMQVALE